MSNNQSITATHNEQDAVRTVEGTTGIDNDAAVETQMVSKMLQINKNLVHSSTTAYVQSLKDFFAKPVAIRKSTTTGTTVTEWGPISMPSYQFQNFALIYNKLTGFVGFKSTMVFRLQMNANPFQQGIYFLSFTHTGGATVGNTPANPSGRALAWYNSHNATLCQRTQVRRAELNVSCDTEAILKIPYISGRNYTSTVNASPTSLIYGDTGFLALQTYTPLVSPTGSVNIGYTIWMHHEDVELLGPAGPQSGFEALGEQKKAGIGPISGAAAAVKRLAGVFGRVPTLSQYATQVSWVSDLIGNAAQSVGWSAPANLMPQQRMGKHIMAYHGNVDAADNSQLVSLSCRNEVDKLPGFAGTDNDEMDLNYIASIPAYYASNNWARDSAAGTVLFQLSVSPSTFQTTVSGAAGSVYNNYTPVAFVASLFKYWRGSLTFTIKFAKTQYHSGRLAISFFPGYAASANYSILLNDSDYVYREIVDIRDTTKVTFTVPFIYDKSYCASQNSIGTIMVHVLDPLVSPSSVSSTVTLLLEVGAGPDFEVAVPYPNNGQATFSIAPQSGFERDDCAIINTCIGGSSTSHDGYANAAASVGERITSFRQLLKLNSPLIPSGAAGYTASVGTGTFCTIVPYAYSVGHLITSSPPTPPGTNYVFQDLYSKIVPLFALSRGGIRIKATMGNYNNTPSSMFLCTMKENDVAFNLVGYASTFDFTRTATNPETYSEMAPRAFCAPTEQALEIAVGAYGNTYARNNLDLIINDQYNNSSSVGYLVSEAYPAPAVALVMEYNNTGQVTRFYRSVADDFSLGCFVSVPLIR